MPLHLKGKDEQQMLGAQAMNFRPIVSTVLLGFRQHAEESNACGLSSHR